jgi:NADPH:quinone reductase-like Zn-dependent oxidoreductase
MKYRSVVVTRRGGPEVMRVVENELRAPSKGEVRARVTAAPVCAPDVEARRGRTPFPPRIPFVPGYAFVGVVDALGDGVERFTVGDRVAALTVYGGYAEHVYIGHEKLIPVPADLDPVETAPLILNYIVAYQALHRSAGVKAGDRVLVVGASGGIGTAFLQLGALAGLTMYGIASGSKHGVLSEHGATPIDYRMQDFVDVVREAEPDGLDAVFDGVGGDYIKRAFPLLRRGGVFVEYANPLTLRRTVRTVARVYAMRLWPNGRSATYYSTGRMFFNRRAFLEDWAALFRLLGEGEIKPIIAAEFPVPEAAEANRLLESGRVIGNVVLVGPDVSQTD